MAEEIIGSGVPSFELILQELGRRRFDPFAGSTLIQPRLLWHQQVHRHYGERCVFLLVRVQGQSPKAAFEQLDALIDDCNIVSRSVSLLYGYFDALIRVWASPVARDRLIARLESSIGLVAVYDEFQVEQIRYGWTDAFVEKDALEIEGLRDEIETVCDAIDTDRQIDAEVLRKLFDRGFIYALGTRPRASIRFYILFAPLPGTSMRQARGLEAVLNYIKNTSIFGVVTTYSGIGFASHLFSLYAPDLDGVRTALDDLEELARSLSMRTFTLLVANTDVTENDALRPHDVPSDLSALGNILGSGAELTIAGLEHKTQQEIASVFRRYRHLLNSDFRPLFLSLFRSRLEGDVTALNDRLGITNHFELLFRRYIVFEMKTWLSDWEAAAVPAATALPKVQAELQRGTSPDQLSMGSLAEVFSVLVNSGSIPRERLTRHFGEGFPNNIRNFTTKIRNPFAHGYSFAPKFRNDFLEQWTFQSQLICQIGDIYVSLLEDEGSGATGDSSRIEESAHE